MRTIAPEPSRVTGTRGPVAPVLRPRNRHHELARRIRRLGTGPRHNAVERFIVERESIAREVEMIGDERAESAQ